ncbi:MAG: HI0074 family nucleotidyltransferase substrate-binding subunit [Candidatus Hydrogenedentota bacterium]
MSLPVLGDFVKSIERLKEVLLLVKTPVIRDSAIKRFEICFDLAWKSIKSYAKKEGIECNSPRSAFKTAFELKLIDYDERWLEMIDDRNLTAHIYKEEYAEAIFLKLNEYTDMFNMLSDKLQKAL